MLLNVVMTRDWLWLGFLLITELEQMWILNSHTRCRHPLPNNLGQIRENPVVRSNSVCVHSTRIIHDNDMKWWMASKMQNLLQNVCVVVDVHSAAAPTKTYFVLPLIQPQLISNFIHKCIIFSCCFVQIHFLFSSLQKYISTIHLLYHM